MMGEGLESDNHGRSLRNSLSRSSHGLAEDHFLRLLNLNPGGLAISGNPSQSDPHGRDPFKLRESGLSRPRLDLHPGPPSYLRISSCKISLRVTLRTGDTQLGARCHDRKWAVFNS